MATWFHTPPFSSSRAQVRVGKMTATFSKEYSHGDGFKYVLLTEWDELSYT
jgi:hypothetical protein